MATNTPLTFSKSGATSPSEINLKETVEKLLLVLSEKEKFIIQHRFCLNVDSRKTLEAIGQHYGVTRERIRQIEKNALKKLKRNAANTNLKTINEVGKAIVKKQGGALIEEKLVELMLATLPNIKDSDVNALKLSLALDPELTKSNNTLDFHPHWRTNDISLGNIREITSCGYKTLKKNKDVMTTTNFTAKVQEKLGAKVSEGLIISAMQIGKETKFVKSGIGLLSWRHINPRTLRDKINFILQKEKKPLHFEDISKKIIDTAFDEKKVNVQAVHNELIRNEHFVLIGRGIYALDSWGYKAGTVGDVLKEILKDGKARTRDEIMKAVLKQRQVKKITIYLNLKNNPKIKTLKGDKYQWVK